MIKSFLEALPEIYSPKPEISHKPPPALTSLRPNVAVVLPMAEGLRNRQVPVPSGRSILTLGHRKVKAEAITGAVMVAGVLPPAPNLGIGRRGGPERHRLP